MRAVAAAAAAWCAALAGTQGAAQAKWLKTSHDFGVIDEADGPVRCRMRMVNTADTAIVITSVRTTCGCTAVDYPRMPISGGDTATVTVTYDPSGRPGDFSRDIAVRTSAQPARTILNITGRVIATPATVRRLFPTAAGPIALKTSILALGKLTKGAEKTVYLHGYNAGADTMTISPGPKADELTVTALTDTIPPGGSCTLAVKITTSASGQYWGPTEFPLQVLAMTADGTEAGTATVTAIANLEDDFTGLTDEDLANAPVIGLSDDKIDFGQLTDTPTTRQLTITNRGPAPLAIHRIASDSPKSVTARPGTATVSPGGSLEVTIDATAPADGDDFLDARLTIYCDDPRNPAAACRLVGTVSRRASCPPSASSPGGEPKFCR